MSKPRAITELLANNFSGPLEQTIQRSKKLHQLTRWIQNILSPELAAHCHVQNIRNSSLIMACDSTVWATRLRYQTPTLLETLRRDAGLNDLIDIQIRVQPAEQPPKQQTKHHATLSTDAAYCIQQCSESISDPELRRALERLAGRQRD